MKLFKRAYQIYNKEMKECDILGYNESGTSKTDAPTGLGASEVTPVYGR